MLATVNKLKGQVPKWDDASQFDASKDKTTFRQYEEACDRVKNFYREQHGAFSRLTRNRALPPRSLTLELLCLVARREANLRL